MFIFKKNLILFLLLAVSASSVTFASDLNEEGNEENHNSDSFRLNNDGFNFAEMFDEKFKNQNPVDGNNESGLKIMSNPDGSKKSVPLQQDEYSFKAPAKGSEENNQFFKLLCEQIPNGNDIDFYMNNDGNGLIINLISRENNEEENEKRNKKIDISGFNDGMKGWFFSTLRLNLQNGSKIRLSRKDDTGTLIFSCDGVDYDTGSKFLNHIEDEKNNEQKNIINSNNNNEEENIISEDSKIDLNRTREEFIYKYMNDFGFEDYSNDFNQKIREVSVADCRLGDGKLNMLLGLYPNHHVTVLITPKSVDYKGSLSNFPKIPCNLHHMTLDACSVSVDKIPDDFMRGCTNLKTFHMKGFQPLKIIGNNFLGDASDLVHFSSEDFDDVENIGPFFLNRALKLEEFSASFGKLRVIPDYFIHAAGNLKRFRMEGVKNIKRIGSNFLSYAKNLPEFDTSVFEKLTVIKDNFLSGADKLKKIKTQGLKNVGSIGSNFLSFAENLTEFDTRPLKNLMCVGNNFLIGTQSLEFFDPSNLNKNIIVGEGFLHFSNFELESEEDSDDELGMY